MRIQEETVIQMNCGIMINVDVSVINVCKKDYVQNATTCNCENGKFLASIMDDSAIMCDEVIESYNEETEKFITISLQKQRIKRNYILKKSNKIKDIDIKNRAYYFFEDIINMKNFDSNNIKINEKSNKSILIYHIEYVTIKDSKYVKINSVNPLSLIFNKLNGYFEEINKSKSLRLVSTNESKEKILKI